MQELSVSDEQYIYQVIEIFKRELQNKSVSEELIVQKYIIHGIPYIFKEDQNKYFDLQSIIASHFGEHFGCVHMVGSAKLGFSISPRKLWRPFSDESDIDMAIISKRIFEQFWGDLYNFNIGLTSRNEAEDKKYIKFLKYFFKGWLRPDLFPFKYSEKDRWFDFFKSISYKDGYQEIKCAVYYNYDFFEKYHIMNVKNLRLGVF